MDLDNFMLNSDFDTVKQVYTAEKSINIPSITLPTYVWSQKYILSFPVEAGQYMQEAMIEMSLAEGLSFIGGLGSYYDGRTEYYDGIRYRYYIRKASNTAYEVVIDMNNMTFNTATTKAFTVKAKLHLFTPSTQGQ